MLKVTFYGMLATVFYLLIYDLLKTHSITMIRRWLETSNERIISDYSNYVETMWKEGFLANLNYYQYRVFGCIHRRPWKISFTITSLRTAELL